MTTDTRAFVAKAVLARRTVARLSQAEVAAKCGITRQGLDRIERGLASPSLKMIERLASAFGISPSELLP
jgi:transcriptional regulator with XRE-family HTH domain